jgi:transposase-like protein
MTLAELSKKYGVHATQIGTWKRAAIENMATAFTRRGAAPEQVSAAEVDKLHSKIGQMVVERDFLADASHQLLGVAENPIVEIRSSKFLF